MGIQRWNFDGAEIDVQSSGAGDYVLFTDHEQVVANLTKNHKENLDSWLTQRQEIDRLRAELAAKSKDAETLMDAVRKHGHSMANSEILERLGEMGEGNGR